MVNYHYRLVTASFCHALSLQVRLDQKLLLYLGFSCSILTYQTSKSFLHFVREDIFHSITSFPTDTMLKTYLPTITYFHGRCSGVPFFTSNSPDLYSLDTTCFFVEEKCPKCKLKVQLQQLPKNYDFVEQACFPKHHNHS